MERWWQEAWSVGTGQSKTCCVIARTSEGYAVDLFRGDTCVWSDLYTTREEAAKAASRMSDCRHDLDRLGADPPITRSRATTPPTSTRMIH